MWEDNVMSDLSHENVRYRTQCCPSDITFARVFGEYVKEGYR